MSDALTRIENAFLAFRAALEKCREQKSSGAFNDSEWMTAYDKHYHLLNRYKKDKNKLNDEERHQLSKILGNNKLNQDLTKIRAIESHVKRTRNTKKLVFHHIFSPPIEVDESEVSALSVFAGPIVNFPDIHGELHPLDHLAKLEEFESSVERAFQNISK